VTALDFFVDAPLFLGRWVLVRAGHRNLAQFIALVRDALAKDQAVRPIRRDGRYEQCCQSPTSQRRSG
jgi:hypothetical protein